MPGSGARLFAVSTLYTRPGSGVKANIFRRMWQGWVWNMWGAWMRSLYIIRKAGGGGRHA